MSKIDSYTDSAKVLGVFIIGALFGGAMGVLFAPQKGERTQEKLINSAKDMADDLKRKLRDEVLSLRNKAEDLEELAEKKVNEILDTTKKNKS